MATADIDAIHTDLLRSFKTGKSKSYEFRIEQLRNLKRFVAENEDKISQALNADLHRCPFEAIGLEIGSVVIEIDLMISSLRSWMKPQYTTVPAAFAPASSAIVHEPFGLCLVIGAFNYPFVLSISPVIGAIAAGNAVILKPSEMSSEVEKLLATILPKYLDANFFRVVCGDAAVSSKLLSLRWDKIFFTGSTRVGKIVYKAAAENLTPVSLELGGKSPTIVDKNVRDLATAVKRIAWGKFVNAGQTCIAPDYIYVHKDVYPQFMSELKKQIVKFYGEDAQKSPDLARIISGIHCERLAAMIADSKESIAFGGNVDKDDRYIQPTVLTDVKKDSKVMQEEIFGPILPVFTYTDLDEVIAYVNEGEKPLTMYIFSTNQRVIDTLTHRIASGSVVINDTLFQFGNIFAPFGGVGHSGMGGYHGKFSFECFSQKRSVLHRDDTAILDIPIRYPPYTDFALSVFRIAFALPHIPALTYPSLKDIALVALTAFAAYQVYTQYIPH